MSENVVVAVRCRPFNKREKELGCKCVIHMQGPKTTITDPSSQQTKDFTFDYSYWSHNPEDPHFADNPKVFQDIGVRVLENAWQGYNCCLFAYGQTGSGKSYSMVGYGADKGIVPLAMEELFRRVTGNTDPNVKYQVEVSMLEIYNEKINDLFAVSRPAGGLKLRDHPQTGPYVDGLTKNAVSDYPTIEKLMAQGNEARTVAATQMNATSSRAHTVFQIVFTVTTFDVDTGKTMQKMSKINLVDLAGSERSDKTGATGSRLKEGANINLSLTMLGQCIEKLAKGGKEHIPYRNSVLTRLLQQSLGGNSKTIMIAAISPADDNYDESLSTLRYADRAKQIKNKAIINEDENAKIIRQLKEEIARLKEMVGQGGPSAAPAGLSDQEREEFAKMKEQMAQNEKLMKEMSMSWEEKLKQTEELAASRDKTLHVGADMIEKKKSEPHVVNLNKDPLLSECIAYFFPPKKKVRFVRDTVDPPPAEDDVVLTGVQFLPEHAWASNDGKRVSLAPAQQDARVFVNGQLAREPVVLQHNDRIVLGQHLFFRYVDPKKITDWDDKGGQAQKSEFDFDFAQRELAQSAFAGLLEDPEAKKAAEEAKRKAAEAERKAKELMAQIEAEKKAAAEAEAKREKEYKAQLEEIKRRREEELLRARQALEKAQKEEEEALKKQIAERERQLEEERQKAIKLHQQQVEEQKQRQAALEAKLKKQQAETKKLAARQEREARERALVEENLATAIPLVNEANIICKELSQPLRFEVKIYVRKSADDLCIEEQKVQVRVVNPESDLEDTWVIDQLTDVVAEMREIYMEWLRTNEIVLPDNTNPFVLRPSGPQLLGSVRIFLQAVYNLVPIIEEAEIIDYKGVSQGTLSVKLIVVPSSLDKLPDKNLDLIFLEEDIGQLAGQSIDFWLKIREANGLPVRASYNTFIQYKWPFDLKETRSDIVKGPTQSPVFDYDRRISVGVVTEDFIEFMQRGNILEIQVWGEVPPEVVSEAASGVAGITREEKEWAPLVALLTGASSTAAASSSAAPSDGAAPAAGNSVAANARPGAKPGIVAELTKSGAPLPVVLTKKVEELVTDKGRLEAELEQLRAEKEALEKKAAAATEEKRPRENLNSKLSELQMELELKDQQMKENARELQEAKATAAEAQQQFDDLQRKREAAERDLEMLKDAMKKMREAQAAAGGSGAPGTASFKSAKEIAALREEAKRRDDEMERLRKDLEKSRKAAAEAEEKAKKAADDAAAAAAGKPQAVKSSTCAIL